MPGIGIGIGLSLGGGGGGSSLAADKATYLAGVAQGALIATLSQTFGAGTTFATVGSVPGQLSLTAGQIVAGASASVVGGVYSLKVRATSADSKREVAETLTFTAQAAAQALSIGGTLTSATVGTSAAFAPAIAGGTSPYVLSKLATNPDTSASVFPPGRAIGTGVDALKVTGTYTTEGSYRYTLRVTDNVGATADLEVGPVVVSASVGLAVSRPALALTQFWNLWGDSTTFGVGAPGGSDYPQQLRAIGTGLTRGFHGANGSAGQPINTGGNNGLAIVTVANGGTAGESTGQIAARVTALQADATYGAVEMDRPQIFSGGLNNYNTGSAGFATTLAYGRNWPAIVKSDLAIEVGKIANNRDWFHILAPIEDNMMSGSAVLSNQWANHIGHRRDMLATHGRRVLDFRRYALDYAQPSNAAATVQASGPDYASASINRMIPLSMRGGASLTDVPYNDALPLLYNTGAAGAPASLAYDPGQIAFNQFSLVQYRKVGANGAGSWEVLDIKHFSSTGYALMARMVGDAMMASEGSGPPYATPCDILTTIDVAPATAIGTIPMTGAATSAALTTDRAGTTPSTLFAIDAAGVVTRTANGALTEGLTSLYVWLTNAKGTLRSTLGIFIDKPAAAAPRRFMTSGTGVPLFGRTSHGMTNGTQISGVFLIYVNALADAPYVINMAAHGTAAAGQSSFFARVATNGFFSFGGNNASATSIFATNATVTTAGITAGAWQWVAFSIDVATGQAQFYVGDAARTWAPTFNNAVINWSDPSLMLYASRAPQMFDDGLNVLKGGFGPALLFPGFVDWSVAANRRAVFNADGTPAVRTPFSAVGGVVPKFDTSAGLGGLLFGPTNPADPQSLVTPAPRARLLTAIAP